MALKLYVDPGIQHCGMAVFDGPDLTWAGLVSRPKSAHRLSGPALGPVAGHSYVVGAVEMMRIRPEARRKGNQNDLVDVAFVAGSIGPRLGVFLQPVWPETWKGQVPKKIMVGRVVDKLTATEMGYIDWPSGGGPTGGLNHNVADAIGIGLWDQSR